MACERSWNAAFGVGRSEEERAGFWQDLGEKRMVWDADADSDFASTAKKFVKIKMVEVWIFGENKGELTWYMLRD